MLKREVLFLDKKYSKSTNLYQLEPGLFFSITDFVEGLNTLIEYRHSNNESCVTIKVFRKTKKVESYLADEGSGLAFFSTYLGHILGRKVGIEFG